MLDTISDNVTVRKSLSQWVLNIDNISEIKEHRNNHLNIFNYNKKINIRKEIKKPIDNNYCNVGVHVAAWRNHFYLGGEYTKDRRDVSQTPFFVPSHQKYSNKVSISYNFFE